MKTGFFGDSYDIVKRTLLEWLQPLGNWAVHPMFTEEVRDEFAVDFSSLIGAPLISVEALRPGTDRESYFRPCGVHQHVFLDPNTGLKIRRDRSERSPDHLFDSDLLPIIDVRPGGLTMVFDQSLSRGRTVKEQLEEKLAHFRAQGFSGFAYTSHACFLFLAREPATAEHAHHLLCGERRLPKERFLQQCVSAEGSL